MMLIKIEYTEESELMPLEITNLSDEIQTRVEHNFVYTGEDVMDRETAKDGSLVLKFVTPWNQVASQEARNALYVLYKNLTVNQEHIKSLNIYNDDIQIFSTGEMDLAVGETFLQDTALTIEGERDNYIGLSVTLTWKEEEV